MNFIRKISLLLLIFFTGNFCLAQYCIPVVTGPQTGNYGISNVSLNTINCNSPTKEGYADSTHLSTSLIIGSNYTFSITVGDVDQGATFWIDFNRDNTFSTSEYFNVGTSLPVGTPIAVNFTVPGNASPGLTRMRVASDYTDIIPIGNPIFASCGPQNAGDIEDYTINLIQADMVFDSCTTIQPAAVTCFKAPQVNAIILRIEVAAHYSQNPLPVTRFDLNTTITTSPSEISAARIWYTAGSDTFRTVSLFGSTAAASGAFAISGNQNLQSGKNYFWLTYDIVPGAATGNFFDASCSAVVVDGNAEVPRVQDPGPGFQIDPSYTSCKTKRTHTWLFGSAQGIDFNCVPPAPIQTAKNDIHEGSACISDSNGELMFYTNGKSVWDKIHLQMPNGSGLMAGEQAAQPAMIIPNPGNPDKYYIFTTPFYGWQGATNGIHPANGPLTYSEVDMTLNSGYGDVVASTKNTIMEDSILQNITAVKNCNETGYWIMVHKYNTNQYYAYQITASGISAPVVSAIGSVINFPIGPTGSGHGQLKFSPDGKHLAFAHLTSGNNKVELFDFNPQTGVVSNLRNLPLTTPAYGISFSPDGTRLYASGSHYSDNYLVQFNLCAGNIANSRVTIDANANINEGLQLAPDGKIYCAVNGKDSLHIIHNPNALGAACNFQKNSFYALGGFVLVAPGMMMGRMGQFSLPDLIQSDVLDCSSRLADNINFTTDSVCYGSATHFTNLSTALPGCFAQARSYKWIFGDALAGAADTAHTLNATHIYSNPGNYLTTLIVSEGCETDTIVQTVVVNAVPVANAGIDHSVAGGTTVQLSGSGGGVYSWTPSDGLSCVNCADPVANPNISTKYILTVTDSSGCYDMDTVFIEVLCTDLFIPNAFSPNGDGQNDNFFVHGNCFQSFYLKIVNRWGDVVFETTDANEKWNGIYNQQELNTGAFVFTMKAITYDGKEIKKKGSIALVR